MAVNIRTPIDTISASQFRRGFCVHSIIPSLSECFPPLGSQTSLGFMDSYLPVIYWNRTVGIKHQTSPTSKPGKHLPPARTQPTVEQTPLTLSTSRCKASNSKIEESPPIGTLLPVPPSPRRLPTIFLERGTGNARNQYHDNYGNCFALIPSSALAASVISAKMTGKTRVSLLSCLLVGRGGRLAFEGSLSHPAEPIGQ
jgi:hypothetical protein